MTDRERLLEQVREAEERAASWGKVAGDVMVLERGKSASDLAFTKGKKAAHHALTALALRDVLSATAQTDCYGFWEDDEWCVRDGLSGCW